MFTQDCNFIFVPVDENFKSLIDDLSTSKTIFPSELDIKGITGFLLIPAFLDTKEILFSPWMKHNDEETPDVTGNLIITARPENDGMIMINHDPANKSNNPLAIGTVEFKKTAVVPGIQQNYGIYLKTGSALILELLMKDDGWDSQTVEEALEGSIRKIGNSFLPNKTIYKQYWDGLSYTIAKLKEFFGGCSSTIGYEIKGETKDYLENKVYNLLLQEFNKDPEYFSILKLDKNIVDYCIEKSIQNLEDSFTEALNKLSLNYQEIQN